ncbi:fibronectin type III domain-containing protein [Bacillus cereus]|uniref:fibronectin type III domain-containing protein n=1 Tax=Bacillus thuringiensis TaxID=1428 RepID=UPI001F15DD75|nr:fibronectin type III domain-containing protein [Bacillus thuringiensis]MCE9706594.1 fibronectin type III domain-containing protein [Bacillus thuringiensis]MEB8829845.1 fibronectin type III domain-containing protein [Bacillus cereus]MED2208163.1 fibronectin type III domain-containing protein [Bacillus thuringiensis]UJT50203.1 fibronectin type III domain-containing protein [Bacillus thuringiensis]
MNLKKCGFLLVFALMFCFAIPNFASAAVVDLLEGKTGIRGSTEFKNMTDGNKSTYDKVYSRTPVMFDLGENFTVDKFTINESNGTESGNPATLHVKYYDSSKKVIADYTKFTITEKKSDVRYVSIEYDYLNPLYVYEFKVYGTTDKVTNVENLKAESDLNQITLSWNNPDTPKFTGVSIYRDKQLIGKLDKTKNFYVVKGLESAKEYEFTVKSIDENGFETSGATKKATTKMPVLPPPDKVFVTPQNGKLVIAWNSVSSLYLQGYNVYVDGKKINDKPLTSNKLIVKNLENDKSYKVQVSTVNKNDVEGEKSKEVAEKPSSDALEVEYEVKMPFNPKDVVGVAMVFLLIVGPLILLGLAFRFYKPIITFLYNSIQNKKGRDEK